MTQTFFKKNAHDRKSTTNQRIHWGKLSGKKRREAVKQRIHGSRNRSRKTSAETNSNEIVKLNSHNRGVSSRKRKRRSQERINLKIKRLENDNALWKRKTERLYMYKRIQRSNKKSSLLFQRRKLKSIRS